MSRTPPIVRFPSVEDLAETTAGWIAETLEAGLATRDRAMIALAGGSTPAPLYRRLARTPLDWSRVVATLADERCAPPDSADSNARRVRETLLQGPAAAASFMPMWTGEGEPHARAAIFDSEFGFMIEALDVVVLGMGEDGHTASLFPHSPALGAGLDVRASLWCVAVPAHGSAPAQPRLSLTLAAILRARRVVLLLTGEAKLETLKRALDGDDVREMPVRAVLHAAPAHVEIAWAP